MLLSGDIYFVRYWAICVLQLFVNQVVTSRILKLTSPKSHDKNLTILRTKRLSIKQITQFFWKVKVRLYAHSK